METVDLNCLKAKAAAEFLDVSPQLLWLLKDEGFLPVYQSKPKAEIWYPLEELIRWKRNNQRGLNRKGASIHE